MKKFFSVFQLLNQIDVLKKASKCLVFLSLNIGLLYAEYGLSYQCRLKEKLTSVNAIVHKLKKTFPTFET